MITKYACEKWFQTLNNYESHFTVPIEEKFKNPEEETKKATTIFQIEMSLNHIEVF